jgi:hypothetical protein
MSRMSESEAYFLAREMFSYNPETGIITRSGPYTRADGEKRFYKIGSEAGRRDDASGYRTIRISPLGPVLAHRLAWLLQTGGWPKQQIDHINGVKDDNRWLNLRDVSHMVNSQNRLKKVGRCQHLPVGIVEKTNKRGYRYFQVSVTRNNVRRLAYPGSLDSAIELLKAFRESPETPGRSRQGS